MERCIGYDAGRMYSKIYTPERKIITMNAICKGYDRRVLDSEDNIPDSRLQNYLDIEITKGESSLGRYFVDGMAFKYHRNDLRTSANGIPKYTDQQNDEIIKLVSHLALVAYLENKNVEEVTYRVGIGSPTEEFFDHPENLEKFKALVVGNYEVSFKHPAFNSKNIKIRVVDIHEIPEGTATIISALYDNDLEANQEFEDYLDNGFVIGCNIGSSSSDTAIIGTDLIFDPKGFFGVKSGSTNALNKARLELKNKFGCDYDKMKLDHYLRTNPIINYSNTKINLLEYVESPFLEEIKTFKQKFYEHLDMNGVDPQEASLIYFAGGTIESINNIEVLKACKTIIENFIPGVKTIISKDPLFDEARGYYITALTAQRESLEAQAEIFTEAVN